MDTAGAGIGNFVITYSLDRASPNLDQVRAVMFRMQNRLLKFEPEDGLQVVCYGRLTVYDPRGEYQIVVDPHTLHAFNLSLQQVIEAVRRSNNDVGGSVIEISEMEYMVRGAGYLGTLSEQEIADNDEPGRARLAVDFNNTSFGRLRRLIDSLNRY